MTDNPYTLAKQERAAVVDHLVPRMHHRQQSLDTSNGIAMFATVGGRLVTTGIVSKHDVGRRAVSYRPVDKNTVTDLAEQNPAIVVSDGSSAMRLSRYVSSQNQTLGRAIEKAHAMHGIAFDLLVDLSAVVRTMWVMPEGEPDPLRYALRTVGVSDDAAGHASLLSSVALSNLQTGSGPGFWIERHLTSALTTRESMVPGLMSLGFGGYLDDHHFRLAQMLSAASQWIETIDVECRNHHIASGSVVEAHADSGRLVVEGTVRFSLQPSAMGATGVDYAGRCKIENISQTADGIALELGPSPSGGSINIGRLNESVCRALLSQGGVLLAPPGMLNAGRAKPLSVWGKRGRPNRADAPVRTMPVHVAVAGGPS